MIGFDFDEDDVESIFSLDDELGSDTLVALKIEAIQDILKVSSTE